MESLDVGGAGSATVGGTVSTGIWPGGTASGSSAPDYADSQYVGGKNPVWNRYGHERMGWGLSVFNPTAP